MCSPGALPTIVAALISVHKISYYKGTIASRSKLHVSIGHDTVMAKIHFFGLHDVATNSVLGEKFDFSKEYINLEELLNVSSKKSDEMKENADSTELIPKAQYALVEFEAPVSCAAQSLVIGAKLDMDIHTTACRLAFHGRLLEGISDIKYAETVLPRLKVYVKKSKEGVVERKGDDYTVICKGLFKKETNIDLFVGLKVKLSSGEDGIIEGSFGQSGKFKVRIPGIIYTMVTLLFPIF